MEYQIPLSAAVFNGNELIYSRQAVESGQLAVSGSFIPRFEKKLSEKLSNSEVVVLNSGTSALHLGLVLLGVEAGDEVICQSFTFCASANPICYLGAKPIFVDSESDTWNMSPEILEDTILNRLAFGKKPKAIVVVHLFGMPAKMKEIMKIARKYDIPVLEDAAEAVGSSIDGKYCGTFGDLGVFSFNGNKIITSGGGGALICNKPGLAQKARHLSTQAREDLPYYQHLEIGYNYKMNNLAASIGLAQLEQLDKFIEKRRSINENYKKLLATFPGVQFQNEGNGVYSNYWLSTILLDEKITGFSNDHLRVVLMKNQIETRFLWKPLHLQPVFNDIQFFGGKVAANLFEKGICLPSSVSLTFHDQEKIAEVMHQEFAKSI
ncbi:aminotransferase class I/II-fold pyridoxal phosphate-dependent enzyme [Algoriphagus sp. CAU 1675]|uniref:aminotransferase class I/II-fold pyridoxal phosphate-dependent enzyme n=1 Tax=Algoriphagus sp. CAU 1675 TaxID=3032597 RepID=UPI0023DB84EC|nr:aminotransferase class I/II-fold pyridoxal phosphate-dependent enzyme [Algoriphagus sp. CAU 1675]MDF2158184.1 DegT/DnrJ/EryC1/StrS family aminotransferase [Algoriphagus sp. CAU 1675]